MIYLLIPILIIVVYCCIAAMLIKSNTLQLRDNLTKDSKVRYIEDNSGHVSAQVKVMGVYMHLNIGGDNLESAKERISNLIIDNETMKHNSKVKSIHY